MRLHIDIDDELVRRVDEVAGSRGRSQFVRSAVESALEQQLRWTKLDRAAGAIFDGDHEWDEDPASWVRDQRRGEARRAG